MRVLLVAAVVAAVGLVAGCGGEEETGPITADQIADGAVETPKLADDAVTTRKLADAAVKKEKVENGAISEAKLAADSVNGEKVADDSLSGADIDESTLEGVNASSLNGSTSFIVDIESVQQTSSLNTNDRKGPITATCPDGTDVVSGGASIVTESGTKLPIVLTSSTSNAGNGWNAEAIELRPVEEGWGLRVVALCGVYSG
jgi:hypothetical protein